MPITADSRMLRVRETMPFPHFSSRAWPFPYRRTAALRFTWRRSVDIWRWWSG